MNENTSAAAEQLRAVETGSRAGLDLSRAGRVHDSLYGVAVGVLVAAMLAIVVYVYPTRQPWLVVSSTVLYGLGIVVAVAVYRRRRKATSRVTARRYRIGFLITIVLYGIGVALATMGLALPAWFWISYIVATALPLVISSGLRIR